MKVFFNEMANGTVANLHAVIGNVKHYYTNEYNEVKILNIPVPCRVITDGYGLFRVTWQSDINNFNSNSEASPVYDKIENLVLEWLHPRKTINLYTRTTYKNK